MKGATLQILCSHALLYKSRDLISEKKVLSSVDLQIIKACRNETEHNRDGEKVVMKRIMIHQAR